MGSWVSFVGKIGIVQQTFDVMYELDFDSVCIILWDQLSTRVGLPTDLCTPW